MSTPGRREEKRASASDRRKIADKLGKALAEKASDELVWSLARARPKLAAAEALGTAGMVSAIVEFTPADFPDGLPTPVEPAAEGLLPETYRLTRAAARWAAINRLRDEFQRDATEVRSALEARAASRAAIESMMPGAMRSAVQLAWLLRAIRTPLDPKALATVAEAKQVERIDLPRRLTADIDGTAAVVGAPALRALAGAAEIGVVVAVIDHEVDIDHPALSGHAIRAENNTLEPWGHPSSHGTAVAGIIASTDATFRGMAPGALVRNYKVLATQEDLSGDDFSGALALQRALEDGALIANCSWGAGPTGDGTSREARACDRAWDLGLTIVKSAGNGGPGPNTMTTPAEARGVIVVGATSREGRFIPDYSSRGTAANGRRPDLVAPGGDLDHQIRSCRVGTTFGDCGAGTSFAAPHVAGLLAVLLQSQPNLTPDQLKQALLLACVPLSSVSSDAQGAGLVVFA